MNPSVSSKLGQQRECILNDASMQLILNDGDLTCATPRFASRRTTPETPTGRVRARASSASPESWRKRTIDDASWATTPPVL